MKNLPKEKLEQNDSEKQFDAKQKKIDRGTVNPSMMQETYDLELLKLCKRFGKLSSCVPPSSAVPKFSLGPRTTIPFVWPAIGHLGYRFGLIFKNNINIKTIS